MTCSGGNAPNNPKFGCRGTLNSGGIHRRVLWRCWDDMPGPCPGGFPRTRKRAAPRASVSLGSVGVMRFLDDFVGHFRELAAFLRTKIVGDGAINNRCVR